MLLEKFLEGARETGAETELINLYDIQFKGCTSCFACKLKGNSVSKCVMKDDLERVLQEICECDVLVLGSPIYFTSVTGEMKSFMERLIFPYTSYEGKPSSFGKKINTAFIYTMNAPAFALQLIGYPKLFRYHQKLMKRTFGTSEYLASTSTYQFDDYIYDNIMKGNHNNILKYKELGDAAKLAVPTPDHFYPLLYALGASSEEDRISCFNRSGELGSLTMTGYLFE